MSIVRRLLARFQTAMPADVWLVVGLGNPGVDYAATRHNVGYRVVELLAGRLDSRLRAHTSRRADVAETHLGAPGQGGQRLVVARPRVYMNESGGPISALLTFYRVPPDRLVVVHDELDLPFGTLRVKRSGGDNGHNGLRSVRAALGTGDYHRVRVGVGRPSGKSAADFVLSRFSPQEQSELPAVLNHAADAVECLLLRGLVVTQREYN